MGNKSASLERAKTLGIAYDDDSHLSERHIHCHQPIKAAAILRSR